MAVAHISKVLGHGERRTLTADDARLAKRPNTRTVAATYQRGGAMRGETALRTNDRIVTRIGKRRRTLSTEIGVGRRYARGGGDSGRAGASIGEILETETRLAD
jgi:hypothetical protein